MKKIGWVIVVLTILVVLFLIFGRTEFLSGLVYNFANHMISWILGIVFSIALILAIGAASEGDDSTGIVWTAMLVIGVVWILVMIFQGPVTRYALYRNTEYQQTDSLVPDIEIRDVPYTVASANFVGTNPDSMTQPGDLDYVQGRWIASIDPRGFWNTLTNNSQGFFVYDPNSEDKVIRITQEMPFAESGWWFNSSTWFVRGVKYFSEFHEILYVQDGDEVIAVISLIQRQGFERWPYVSNVLVVHPSGTVEILSVDQAEADPRLQDIALKPEWLANEEVLAYGYRHGVFNAMFTRKGRIQVQTSNVNDENSAPFHFKTTQGNMWFTPYSPLRGTSLIGMAMTSSHDIDGPVYIWELSEGEAYPGADYMSSLVEGAPEHQEISWYRTGTNGDGGTIESGNKTVLEIIPVIRPEPSGNHLYCVGYTSTAPHSVNVSFYTVIDPKTQMVYQDLFTDQEMEAWLLGEFELQPQSANQIGISSTCTITDLDSMATENLIERIDQLLAELESRAQ